MTSSGKTISIATAIVLLFCFIGVLCAFGWLGGVNPNSAQKPPPWLAASASLAPNAEVTRQNAHPKAAALMIDKFYWDCTDDNSPFGNDNGADALSQFRKWRPEHKDESPEVLIKELGVGLQAPFREWSEINPNKPTTILDFQKNHVLTTGDDIIISTAFAQLMLEGKIDNALKRLAFIAISKEEAPNTIKSRGWTSPNQRKERLAKMRDVIKAAEGKD